MAKNKKKTTTGSLNEQVNQLKAQVANLKLAKAQAAASAGTKKKKNRKKKNKNAKAGGITLRSAYARAVLDPFSVEGARVPDSFMLKTAVGFTKASLFSGAPKFNFTGGTAYCMITFAPMDFTAANYPMYAYSNPSPTENFWDFTNNTAPGTWDFTKPCYAGYSHLRGPTPLSTSRRYTGGGLAIRFRGIQTNTQVDVYAVPKFNGDYHQGKFIDGATNYTRKWTFYESDEVVLPLPVRNSAEAYNWVPSAFDGVNINQFPESDTTFTTDNLRDKLTVTPSNANATSLNVSAWCMQSGLGGWQVFFSVPPGASFEAEYILHHEFIPQGSSTSTNDSSLMMCPSNTDEIEAVCNAASLITDIPGGNFTEGAETPLADLQRLAWKGASQLMAGAMDAAADSGILRTLTNRALRLAMPQRPMGRLRN